jgi:hypothetical protein
MITMIPSPVEHDQLCVHFLDTVLSDGHEQISPLLHIKGQLKLRVI